MLASTVQFSNNDQTPTYQPGTKPEQVRGTGTETTITRSLRTQQRARHTRSTNPFHAEAVLEEIHRVCRIVNVPPMSNRARHSLASGYVLLRKEVIQPHLPVRLPCYDFVPIAGPTFDGSLPYGLGHRLRVLPTFVT